MTDQRGQTGGIKAEWQKALESEVEKKGEKTVPLQIGNPRTSPYFHSVNISSCSEGVGKQWALLVHVIDASETSSRWLQSFINENELCLNPLSFSPCVFVSHSFFLLFLCFCLFLLLPPFFALLLSYFVSICVRNFVPPQHLPSLSVWVVSQFLLHRWLCIEHQLNSQCSELQQENKCYCRGLDLSSPVGIIVGVQTVFTVSYL